MARRAVPGRAGPRDRHDDGALGVSLLEYVPMRLVLATLLVTMGCGKKAQQGLPPADDWDQSSAGAMVSIDKGQRPRSMGQRGADPHAGVPGAPPLDDDGDGGGGGDNPHAGMGGMGGGGDNPHAGMGGMGGGGDNPHAGMGGGVDVTQLGLPPPDPNRKIDPNRRVKGVIKVHAKAKDRVKPAARCSSSSSAPARTASPPARRSPSRS